MAETEVEFDLGPAKALLEDLARKAVDMQPVMDQIGEILINSTKQRFNDGVGPDGTAWTPNSPATLARKSGSKPLIGLTKLLSRTIAYDASPQGVSWGSNMIYAAVQQFGAERGTFGEAANGSPLPWGNIPARPFVGVSQADQNAVETALQDFFDVD